MSSEWLPAMSLGRAGELLGLNHLFKRERIQLVGTNGVVMAKRPQGKEMQGSRERC
jgi:hypothetical protein